MLQCCDYAVGCSPAPMRAGRPCAAVSAPSASDERCDLDHLIDAAGVRWETLFRGFYPRIHDRNLSPPEWLGDYFRTYVERDLSEVLAVSDLRAFENFVRLAAASTAMELNLSRLAGDVGAGQQTARRWLNVLEIGYLAVTLPPHYANFRKRLRKRPRLHFLDTGLVCYLLDIPDAHTLARHPLRGAIFESFVVSELIKSFANRRREAPIYFWRDATGRRRRSQIRGDRSRRRGAEPGVVDGPSRQPDHRRTARPRRQDAVSTQGTRRAALVSRLTVKGPDACQPACSSFSLATASTGSGSEPW